MKIRTGSSGISDPAPGFWFEVHFVDMGSDPNGFDPSGWIFTRRASLARDGTNILVESPASGRFESDGERDGMWVSFAVDYIFPTWYPADASGGGFVYSPALNADQTNTGVAGFTTIGLVATTVGDHGAIAFTKPVWVECN